MRADHVGAVGEGEFLSDMEGVSLDVYGIEEVNVALPAFELEEHRLEALEVFPGLQVPFDVRPHIHEAAEDLLGLGNGIHDPGVKALQLLHQDFVEHGALGPTAEPPIFAYSSVVTTKRWLFHVFQVCFSFTKVLKKSSPT